MQIVASKSRTVYLIILKDYDFSEYQEISIASQLPAMEYCDFCVISSRRFQKEESSNFQKLASVTSGLKISNLFFEYFEDRYFQSIDGYNQLLKSEEFYRNFAQYEIMIVGQADVYLLQPKMTAQIKSLLGKYDYAGAPWFFYIQDTPSLIHLSMWSRKYFRSFRKIWGRMIGFPGRLLFTMGVSDKPGYIDYTFKAGNGGFSVRRISAYLNYFALLSERKIADAQKFASRANTKMESNVYAEDVFWSLFVPRVYKDFKVQKPSDAILVCWDTGQLEDLLKLSRNNYPLAIHGWWKGQLKNFVLEFNKHLITNKI